MHTTILMATLLAAGLASGMPIEDKQLEHQYHRLEAVQWKILNQGAGETELNELREIKAFFVSQGDSAGSFLLSRLQEMNDDEARFLKGSDDPLDGIEYHAYLIDRGTSGLMKYEVSFILADLFPHLSAELQVLTLETISASYTPSTYGREDMQFLHYSMLRIGRRSVPYLLDLTTRKSRQVRCGVSAVLNSVGKDLVQSESETSPRAGPPQLNCHLSLEEEKPTLQEWKTWWEKEGQHLPFPLIPDILDR